VGEDGTPNSGFEPSQETLAPYDLDPSVVVGEASGRAKMAFLFGGCRVQTSHTQNGYTNIRTYVPAERNSGYYGNIFNEMGIEEPDTTGGADMNQQFANGYAMYVMDNVRPRNFGQASSAPEHMHQVKTNYADLRYGPIITQNLSNPFIYESAYADGITDQWHNSERCFSAGVPFVEVQAVSDDATVTVEVINHYVTVVKNRQQALTFGKVEPCIAVPYAALFPPTGLGASGIGKTLSQAHSNMSTKISKLAAAVGPIARKALLSNDSTSLNHSARARSGSHSTIDEHVGAALGALGGTAQLYQARNSIQKGITSLGEKVGSKIGMSSRAGETSGFFGKLLSGVKKIGSEAADFVEPAGEEMMPILEDGLPAMLGFL
jgi:hypothetical protein